MSVTSNAFANADCVPRHSIARSSGVGFFIAHRLNTAFGFDVNRLFGSSDYDAFMTKTPYERLEAERLRRALKRTDWAVGVLGLNDLQTYNNWRNRGGVPIAAAPDIATRLRWSLDYLWFGRGKDDNRVLSEQESAVLVDLAELLDEDRDAFVDQLHAMAEKARRYKARAPATPQVVLRKEKA